MKLKVTLLFIAIGALLTIGLLKKDLFVSGKSEVVNEAPVSVYKKAINDYLLSDEIINYQEVKVSLKDKLNNNQMLITHFWASWCSPCVNEIPELISYAKKNKKAVEADRKTIVVVSLDEDKENLTKFLKSFPELDTDLFIRVWDNKNTLARLVNADRLPMTVIIDNNRAEPILIRGQADWKGME